MDDTEVACREPGKEKSPTLMVWMYPVNFRIQFFPQKVWQVEEECRYGNGSFNTFGWKSAQQHPGMSLRQDEF